MPPPIIQMGILFLAAFSYFCFHTQYLLLAGEALELPAPTLRRIFCSFFPNFLLFTLYSSLQFHLILNWMLFLLYFYATTRFLFHAGRRETAVLSLSSILCGLSLNSISRSLAAILMDVPLISMDNQIMNISNYKSYPVIVGFLLSGLVLWYVRRSNWSTYFKTILREGSNLIFLVRIFVVMYGYLVLNLLLYYTDSNALILKLWGIASAIFAFIEHMVAVRFAARMSQLNEYSTINPKEEAAISDLRREEEAIRQEGFTDPLTACWNRHAAQEALVKYTALQKEYCLCFLDLNRLKLVNDSFGHQAGDHYILAVANALRAVTRSGQDLLFRYGGDEFLLLLPHITPAEAQKRLASVNDRLRQSVEDDSLPYKMAVSFGIVQGRGGADYQTLLKEADTRMYQMKWDAQERGS